MIMRMKTPPADIIYFKMTLNTPCNGSPPDSPTQYGVDGINGKDDGGNAGNNDCVI